MLIRQHGMDDFRKRRLQLDCPQMILKQQTEDAPITFVGPGYIRQHPDGSFTFRVYSGEKGASDHIVRMCEGLVGELIAENLLYSLSATDWLGRTWTSSSIKADPNGLAGFVEGSLAHVQSQESRQGATHDGLTLEVLDDIVVPCNEMTTSEVSVAGQRETSQSLSAAKFTSCNCTFLLTRQPGSLRVRVTAGDRGLPDHIETRITETLQFVLARPVRWSVMEKLVAGTETLCLWPTYATSGRSRLQPPICISPVDSTGCVWKLFDRYLQHIIEYPGDEWHPLTDYLYLVYEASTRSIDAEALTLGVAVEGVLKNVVEYIHSQEWKRSVKGRLSGCFGKMNKSSARGRLKELKEKKVITLEQIEAWESIRNPTAHADFHSLCLEEKVRGCDKLTVLLYNLIFQAIGYQGIYADYATLGYPDREFTPVSMQDQTAEETVGSAETEPGPIHPEG